MLYGELPEVKLESGDTVRGIRVRVPNPPKSAVLRLPKTEEMMERLSQQKSIRHNLGRRKSKTEFVPNPAADQKLFQKIRLDKGEEFDDFEAGNIISKLTFCEVTGCERVGDDYKITLNTAFGETVHTLSIPTQRDIHAYRRSLVSSVDLAHGQEELRYRVEPAMTLYDQVFAKIEGYASADKSEVPPHHKSAVVIELVTSVDDLDPILDPNF